MTERQWLDSIDPREMLSYAIGHDATASMLRRLKSIVYTIAPQSADNWRMANYPHDPIGWLHGWTAGTKDTSLRYGEFPRTCAIIRCVLGNPFRPVTIEPAWLTPDVLAVTRTLGGKRKVCDNCCGKGFWISDYDGTRHDCGLCKGRIDAVVCPNCFGKATVREDGPYASRHNRVECGRCRGRGGFPPDGTLDPARLAVLADALVDAGLPETVTCHVCDGKEWVSEPVEWVRASGWNWCEACEDGCIPHPALAHLRSGGPHVRGCHVVDRILGEGVVQ